MRIFALARSHDPTAGARIDLATAVLRSRNAADDCHAPISASSENLCRWHRWNFVRQRTEMHGSVVDSHLRLSGVCPGQRMLQPRIVAALGEILPRMAATALLAIEGALHRHGGLGYQVLKLEGLDQ